MKRDGFTLIELLVVIAIIAILAAILFPVMTAVKEKGRTVKCLSNVKQVSNAMMLYLQDNCDGFPKGIEGNRVKEWNSYKAQLKKGWPGYVYWAHDGDRAGRWVTWMDSVYPYVKNLNVMLCPTAGKRTYWWYAKYGQPISFALNPAVSGCMTNGALIIPSRLSEIKRPTGFIMIYDCNSGMSVTSFGYWVVVSLGSEEWAKPHQTGMNIGFADGHAKWYKHDDPLIQEGARDYTSPHWYLTR